MIIFSIIIGILLFMSLVVLHELGHFIAAKRSGVKVHEFGIGIPPRLFTYYTDKSGTKYTINAIPLGGFVRLKGEDPTHSEEFHAKDSFISANLRRKAVILVAGVFMNALIAYVLFTFWFVVGVKPLFVVPENTFSSEYHSYLLPTLDFLHEKGFLSGTIEGAKATIQAIAPESIASSLGLQTGDTVLSLNDQPVNTYTIGRVLKRSIGTDVNIAYLRSSKVKTGHFSCPEDSCLLGILMEQSGNAQLLPVQFSLGQALIAGRTELSAQTALTFDALGNLGKNLVSFDGHKTKAALNKLSGPVGAIKLGDTILQEGGWIQFLMFGGMISLALAIFNILPLPALDGGRLLGVIIQSVGNLKKETYFNIENTINTIFFILLMALGIYIMLKDLVVARGVRIPFIG